MKFSHLHVHTQFSILDGAATIERLFLKAKQEEMPALAITDHGNMFGVFQFVKEANKHNIKPIIGCEFYLVEDRHKKHFTKEQKDNRYHQLLLAKNKNGYENLIKLCSLGYIDGLYSKYPRIDKELVTLYHKNLIATTCCLAASIPKLITKGKYDEAEKELKWWLNIFKDDFYIELQRHGLKDDEIVNTKLLEFSKKYNIKIIATNDSHYVEQSDANFHDILLCINTGNVQSTPRSTEEGEKGKRLGFAKADRSINDVFYFKNTQEMSDLFSDLPQAIDNTNEIVSKVDNFQLTRDILLPNFKVQEPFKDQNTYLRYLTEEGAKKRYGAINTLIQERINLEIGVIEKMDFAGYFLIVADFIDAARKLGVSVGPGRGSAAGSLIAYCLQITDVDPIKHNLLFERFLNPDRKSMPDIDIDFDDLGREKVIEYVVKKYNKEQVAQIITYTTMAAKTSIRDAARVLELPLNEADMLAKLVPDNPATRLNKIISLHVQDKLNQSSYTKDQIKNISKLADHYNYSLPEENMQKIEELHKQIKEIDKKIKLIEDTESSKSPLLQTHLYKKMELNKKLKSLKIPKLRADVLKEAMNIEGMIRNVGTHAAGIIIAPKDLKDIIPVMKMKDSEMYVSQYEGSVIEEAGVVKMDFLGLKTLTIIKDTLQNIKITHPNLTIDINNIPLDDAKTYELYQKGETNGTFQFESPGMQKYLKELVPDRFEDLVALNALYRPGPMEYIDNYIKRKHKQENVSYDLPEMEEYLSDTYGITVYQEQVMLLAQKLSGISKGDADLLRKAMGKKDKKTLDKLKDKFMEGASKNNYDKEILKKIWMDWESFAAYAFNKSHSVCYALLAYRTAYLKAHYPAEYMAAVLTNTHGNLSKITFFIEECKRMKINVLGPDVNASLKSFSAYSDKEIRFGLEGIKGLGAAWVTKIIDNRENNKNSQNGAFKNFEDFVTRIKPNKPTLEALAYSGALDKFVFNKISKDDLSSPIEEVVSGIRAIYTYKQDDGKENYIEKVIAKNKIKKTDNQLDLLSGDSDASFPIPILYPEYPEEDKLAKEKQYLGIYLSGHPLHLHKEAINSFCNSKISDIDSPEKNKILVIAGTISELQTKTSKAGRAYLTFIIEDEFSSKEMVLFGSDYTNYKDKIKNNTSVYIKGEFKASYTQKDLLTFKIIEIGLLSEIFDNMSQGIEIKIDVSDIDGIFTNQIIKILSSEVNVGHKQVFVTITDNAKQAKLYSDKYKVKISDNLLQDFNKFGISFTIKK